MVRPSGVRLSYPQPRSGGQRRLPDWKIRQDAPQISEGTSSGLLHLDGTLFKHLSEIDHACNERMEVIASAMARQEDVTEALKAADQMEWVCRKNSIHNRAEEIVLTELVYD